MWICQNQSVIVIISIAFQNEMCECAGEHSSHRMSHIYSRWSIALKHSRLRHQYIHLGFH